MFLLGIWAGQTVLLPSSEESKPQALLEMASGLWRTDSQKAAVIKPGQAVKVKKETLSGNLEKEWSQGKPDEDSLFSLQVGSFHDQKKAHRSVLGWQARGHEAFFLSPEEDSDLYRVFVGTFENLSEANKMAADLESNENVRAYITLLPESDINNRNQ